MNNAAVDALDTPDVADHVEVRNAHLHNLQNVDVDIPRGQLVAFTGISGSGKSSLAFGTLHGEGQRRYLESMAPFARRLIGQATDPQVGSMRGLPPTVALKQSTTTPGARSTVGTISTVSNTLRLLFSRCGSYPDDFSATTGAELNPAHPERLDSDAFSPNTVAGMCPTCQGTGIEYVATEASMVPDPSLSIREGAIAAWPGAWAGKNFRDILDALGYDLDRPWQDLDPADRDWILFTRERPVVEIVPHRGADQVQRTYQGTWRSVAQYLYKTMADTESDSLRRRTQSYLESHICDTCKGTKLNRAALQVSYLGGTIAELSSYSLENLAAQLYSRRQQLAAHASDDDAEPDAEILLLNQLLPIVESIVELGIGHLSVDRPAASLSSGELQRLRLAAQLRSSLFGVTYVLDEPSAGLHPHERDAVYQVMRRLVGAGNSVFLVEHDMDLVARADFLVDVGPGAGTAGGRVVYAGDVESYSTDSTYDTPTARALRQSTIALKDTARPTRGHIQMRRINAQNLRDVNVDFGIGQITAVVGVSGSGKTTLVSELMATTGEHSGVSRVVHIDNKPIGRTPRSTLATYTGIFDRIRSLFAAQAREDLAEQDAQATAAQKKKWSASRFSYNTSQGQCEQCSGAGKLEVELVFLPGSYTTCPRCHGARYNDETLRVRWHGYTIADILGLTVSEAAEVFREYPAIARTITVLDELGLGYLTLGQGAPELSGGEAQRIKLATELQRVNKKSTLYILDEPTTGLHPVDSDKLVDKLSQLADDGATVVYAEHQAAAIARADRVIELGPGAGERGGRIVASGTPAELARQETPTGRWLSTKAQLVD